MYEIYYQRNFQRPCNEAVLIEVTWSRLEILSSSKSCARKEWLIWLVGGMPGPLQCYKNFKKNPYSTTKWLRKIKRFLTHQCCLISSDLISSCCLFLCLLFEFYLGRHACKSSHVLPQYIFRPLIGQLCEPWYHMIASPLVLFEVAMTNSATPGGQNTVPGFTRAVASITGTTHTWTHQIHTYIHTCKHTKPNTHISLFLLSVMATQLVTLWGSLSIFPHVKVRSWTYHSSSHSKNKGGSHSNNMWNKGGPLAILTSFNVVWILCSLMWDTGIYFLCV